MTVSRAMICTHKYDQQEAAIYPAGLCPLCLSAENARLRDALETIRTNWSMLNQYDIWTLIQKATQCETFDR